MQIEKVKAQVREEQAVSSKVDGGACHCCFCQRQDKGPAARWAADRNAGPHGTGPQLPESMEQEA